MAYFGSSFSSDSPVLTISPQTAHQALSLGIPTYSNDSPFNRSMLASQHRFAQPPPQRPTGAGRKRSRDEAEVNLADDLPEPTPIAPIKEAEEEWIYGEGMVLIKPGSGYVADASSQSGTWVEEQATAVEEARKTEAAAALQRQIDQRPSLRSYKSQRLEQSVTASPGAGAELNCPSPPKSSSSLSQEVLAEPVVDAFTIHLGIGWRRISDDEHIQAAARGWAKFIENHFPLSHVSVRLESKGLQSYLVESREGYFLFSENLREGRLVSTTVEGVLQNLKSNPPLFDSPNTYMVAVESPQPVASQPVYNNNASVAMEGDVEMEVC